MTTPLSRWLVFTRPVVAGFHLAGDTLNVAKSGHLSGAGRGSSVGLQALPGQLVDFAWSLPSALFAGGLRDRIGVETVAGQILGGAIAVMLVGICVRAWLRPVSDHSRPLALVALGYSLGMAVLHCVGEFDPLYAARTALPVVPLLLLLVAELLGARRAWVLVVCFAIAAAGLLAAARGLSREIAADVRPAVTALRGRVQRGDKIAINDHAFAVSAYFAAPAPRVFSEYWNPGMEERFIVIAGKPLDRGGNTAPCAPQWLEVCARLVATNRYRYLVREPQLIALERIAAPPAATGHRPQGPSHR